MKKASLVILLSACSSAYAELPVVIDHSSYPPSATPTTNNAPSANTLYELLGRLEQLQAEVQQLTGKVDEQAYRIDELKKHQSTMYSDFDERIQGIENKANGVVTPVAGSSSEADGAANESVPSSPASESVLVDQPVPVNSSVSSDAPAVESSSAEKVTESESPKPQVEHVSASSDEKQNYQKAYNELRNGHTKQSIEQFNAYLTNFPSGVYANNAQYWLGEAYRVDQDNNASRKAFNDVIEKYPDGSKVPDALLRLGMLEMEQKNVEKAREYFTRVTTEYPNSTVATIAAKKLLKLDEIKN
ncbi:MAG: tol-pal system protein YbgF [Bacteroidota bacterium]